MFKAIKIAWRLLSKGTKEFKEAYLALIRVKEEGIDVYESARKIKGIPSKATFDDLIIQIREMNDAVGKFIDEGADVVDLFIK